MRQDYIRYANSVSYRQSMVIARAMACYGHNYATILEYRMAYGYAVQCAIRCHKPTLWHSRMADIRQLIVDTILSECQDPEHGIRATIAILEAPLSVYYAQCIKNTRKHLKVS